MLEAFHLHRCSIVPFKAGSVLGAIHQVVEYVIHKILFLAAGHPQPELFSSVICAVGYREQ